MPGVKVTKNVFSYEERIKAMRRFVFRAWNNKKKEWQHKEPCDILGEMILLGGWMSGVSIRDLNDIIVMQFTGLKDKNGKEVYEGDFIKSEIHNPSIFQVEFIEGGFCCTYKDSYPIDINHFYPSVGCQIEVIGNIFDNPELKG